jgi:hypothetical protein
LRNCKWQEQSSGVEVLGLVPLARGATANKILHNLFHVREVKVAAKSMQRALDALVSLLMYRCHDLLKKGRRWWYV